LRGPKDTNHAGGKGLDATNLKKGAEI
jgi:hypothetical protein